jgi:hypothetical protein
VARCGARTYLDPFAEIGLEDALGLSVVAGGDHWRTTARRELRDAALLGLGRELYAGPPAVARRAAKIERTLSRYEASRWRRRDRHLAAVPAEYSAIDRLMFTVLRAGGGRVPSFRTLRKVLAGSDPY